MRVADIQPLALGRFGRSEVEAGMIFSVNRRAAVAVKPLLHTLNVHILFRSLF